MKKKVMLLTLIISTFLLTGAGFTFQNEPDGFRGLKWGDPPTKEMIYHPNLLGTGGTKVYTRPKDEMYVENIQFDFIAYLYDKSERFTMAVLRFSEEKKFDLLKNICRERFGIETKKEIQKLTWQGSKTAIVLAYDISKREGELSFVSLEVWAKLKSEQQNEIKKVIPAITLDEARRLVEVYNQDPGPLSLTRFGEAFLILAKSQEKEKKYREALRSYTRAYTIFRNIRDELEIQDRWDYKGEKSIEYYSYRIQIIHKLGFSIFKVACMQLKIGLKTIARDNFLAIVRGFGIEDPPIYVRESLKILKKEFNIDIEDLRSFGVEGF